MDSAADHLFDPKSASLALKKAVTELAEHAHRPVTELVGERLGDLFDLAVETYCDQLPDFWIVWNSWNQASDTPAPWGDL